MEMPQDLPLAVYIGLALVLGLALGVFWSRTRSRDQVASAVATAEAAMQVSVAEANLKAQQAQATLDAKLEELDRLVDNEHALRNQLDSARDEVAQLRERASRVPTLEEQLRAGTALALSLQARVTELTGESESHRASAEALSNRLESLRAEHATTAAALGQHQAALAEAQSTLAATEQTLKGEREGATEKIALLTEAKDQLTLQFKAIAGEILEANSRRFAEQNQDTLGQLLNPLRDRLQEFQQKVEHVYGEENKDRASLRAEVQQMLRMNQTLATQAKDLTSALRGSTKTQGNWGELILERVLESSGLRKGIEYVLQDHQSTEEGRRQRPDVVINLPEDRRLVVDAKVSLIAFERFAVTEDDAERAQALRQHLDSVRTHVKGLSERRYQTLYGTSFDFVLMFIPIEPAFMAAVNHDQQLFMDAWERNVLLVSPSTLLFVLRSVVHLWRQEAQTRNAQEIAKRGAELFDKLSLFADELETVGERLNQAQTSFTEARKRLATGKGNAIRQAQMLVELGVKPTKPLPKGLSEMASADAERELLPASRPEALPPAEPEPQQLHLTPSEPSLDATS